MMIPYDHNEYMTCCAFMTRCAAFSAADGCLVEM